MHTHTDIYIYIYIQRLVTLGNNIKTINIPEIKVYYVEEYIYFSLCLDMKRPGIKGANDM